MGKDGDDGHPARDALKGIGLLFRAGRKTAKKIKEQIDHTHVGKSIDDAGKEIARAIDNVVGRVVGEKKDGDPDAKGEAGKRDADRRDADKREPGRDEVKDEKKAP